MGAAGGSSEDFYRPQDFELFKRTAKIFRVYIAVRRINKDSLPYIGAAGYEPKLVDCKAKTAKSDVTINGKRYRTAGLVVDCEVFRLQVAELFTAPKVKKSLEAWEDFVATRKRAPLSFYDADGQAPMRYDHGYSYFTQLDPKDPHYGCIRRSPSGGGRGGKYIHADYDLYAVVSPDDTENVFVREERLGQPHSRSKHQMNVQNYITSHIPGLINHGEQDTFKRDLDDEIDLFYPDGKHVEAVIGAEAIANLYKTIFRNRTMRSAKEESRNRPIGTWDRT
jgi:hypothetical protein